MFRSVKFWSRERNIYLRRSRKSPPAIGDQEGVTAMEILIVLVVVGIMTALAMPLILGNMESYRVRVAAWEMAGDLRLARQRAVSLQKSHRICLSTCGSPVPTGGYLLERQQIPMDPTSWVVDLVRTDIPNGVALTTTAPGGKLTFGSKGEVWGASGTMTLTNVSGTYQVATATSGRVRVCKGTCP